jgi:hypothetical protein
LLAAAEAELAAVRHRLLAAARHLRGARVLRCTGLSSP